METEELKSWLVAAGNIGITSKINATPNKRFLDKLIESTEFLDNPTLYQRIWHINNNIYEKQKCKNCLINDAIFRKRYICCSIACSKEYRAKSNKQTCLSRYGVDNISLLSEVVDKITATNFTRYGNNMSVHGELQKEKTKTSMLSLYGVDNAGKSKELSEKGKKSSLETYGCENPGSSKIIQEKGLQTMIERYGDHSSRNENVKSKIRDSLSRNLGVKNPMKSPSIVNKMKQTSLNIYGVDNPSKNEKVIQKIRDTKFNKNIDELKNNGYDKIRYHSGINTLKSNKCDHEFEISTNLLYYRNAVNHELCTVCNPIIKSWSSTEKDLLGFIRSIYDGEIIENHKLGRKEIDIFLPDLKLAFEFNGLYWHSELFKDNNYHKNKRELCLNNDITLMNVWEDDWIHKQDIIKSIISGKIGCINNKIYARKCEVIDIVDSIIIKQFLNKNHIQGYASYSSCVGLKYSGEIVAIMTFVKNNDIAELNRMCFKLHTKVIGGANKMLSFYKNSHKCHIVSFADISIFDGKVYEKMGFKKAYTTAVNYWYVDLDSVMRIHRRRFQKMDKNEIKKYPKIFGCGLDKYEI